MIFIASCNIHTFFASLVFVTCAYSIYGFNIAEVVKSKLLFIAFMHSVLMVGNV